MTQTSSPYTSEHPFTVLRRADCEFGDDGSDRLSAAGEAQLVAAATAIQAHYGHQTTFCVFGVSSAGSGMIAESARRLYALLGERAKSLSFERILLEDFLSEVKLLPNVIPVVVSNEPSVNRLLMRAYVTADWSKVDGTISVLAQFGEPHFFRVAQAKDPVFTRPKSKVRVDTD